MKEFKGDIEGFPEEIVEKMLDYQVAQGNWRDVTVFEKNYTVSACSGGFDWASTPEGDLFWVNVISRQRFNTFFEKYPKKSEYPKVMLVSENKVYWSKRVVFMEKCERFLAWDTAETLEEAENVYLTASWKYAKDFPVEQPIPEYTMEELTEKLGHNFKIKK